MTASAASLRPLTAATDGSALGNPGPGGWCWFVDEQCHGFGGDPGPVTNNQMEIVALIRLLQAVPVDRDLVVEADSQYVINAVKEDGWHRGWVRRGWRNSKGEPVANRELFEELLALLAERRSQGSTTTLQWVRGHNGHQRNERADELARCAASSAQAGGARVRSTVGDPTAR